MSGEIKNFLSATMKNHPPEIGKVLKEFDDFAHPRQIPAETIQKVKVSLDELLNNSVSYGFPDGGEHEIRMVVECAE
jgi:two-component sensor histidine kinase